MSIKTTISSKATPERQYHIYTSVLELSSGEVFKADSICPNAAENKVYFLARKAKQDKKNLESKPAKN